MRACSPALAAFLAGLRAQRDAPVLMADCYTFTLRSGAVIAVTSADVAVTLDGTTFRADSLLVDGLQYRCSTGLDVDRQRITIAARPTDTVGGVPFLAAVGAGLLDGCAVQRDRAYLASWSAPPVGFVTLFKGRVATVDAVGRTQAELTVASDLVLLDTDMPRNLYQPACNHVLYDSGCGLAKSAYGTAGTVGAGATPTLLPWSGAVAAFAQGTVTFTSGGNAGATANIKAAGTGMLTLSAPLPAAPAAGDGFTAYLGCDHTLATCRGRFGNGGNFRGFPFVPAPETAY